MIRLRFNKLRWIKILIKQKEWLSISDTGGVPKLRRYDSLRQQQIQLVEALSTCRCTLEYMTYELRHFYIIISPSSQSPSSFTESVKSAHSQWSTAWSISGRKGHVRIPLSPLGSSWAHWEVAKARLLVLRTSQSVNDRPVLCIDQKVAQAFHRQIFEVGIASPFSAEFADLSASSWKYSKLPWGSS